MSKYAPVVQEVAAALLSTKAMGLDWDDPFAVAEAAVLAVANYTADPEARKYAEESQENRALLEVINLLWGWMGVPEVLAIKNEDPWLHDFCRQVHEHVDHDGPTPQR